MKKYQNYSFWISLSAAVVILLNAFGKAFGFNVQNGVIEDCIMAVAGVLVVLGIVVMDINQGDTKQNHDEENDDIENEDNKTNNNK